MKIDKLKYKKDDFTISPLMGDWIKTSIQLPHGDSFRVDDTIDNLAILNINYE